MDITYWKEKHFIDYIPMSDAIKELLVSYGWHDHIRVTDAITSYKYTYNWGQKIPVIDDIQPTVHITKHDTVQPEDIIHFTYTSDFEPME